MSRKLVLLTVFMIVLVGTLGAAFNVQRVGAGGTIYIRADGSIDPPDAPISTADNKTYTLFNNVNGSILIERSGIAINGNNYTIRGYVLTNINNVTIENTVVMGGNGVFLNSSSYVVLSGNVIAQNSIGITIQLSFNNNVSENIIVLNQNYNILLDNSSGNMISKNYIGGMETPQGLAICEYGIETRSSSNNTITQNNVTLCKRAIRFEGYSLYGEDASNNNITGNSIQHLEWGLWFSGSSNNTIMQNNITSVGMRLLDESSGIRLIDHSLFNTIAENNITSNTREGIMLSDSHLNTMTQNDIKYNFDGIVLSSSTLNVVTNNNIEGNSHSGICVQYGYENYMNFIYHNNLDNEYQVVANSFPNNTWDNGYPSGGNYWSDYNGTDANHDGIGDAAYFIDANNMDNYPLMGMFSDFSATSDQHVTTISNSSISDFKFNGTAISFNVAGEDGTAGFCRMCIPKALMNDSLQVFVSGTEILPSPEPLPCSNATHNFLYFTYGHSTQEVVIIPEFPSSLILPLFMAATLLAALVCRKRYPIGK